MKLVKAIEANDVFDPNGTTNNITLKNFKGKKGKGKGKKKNCS